MDADRHFRYRALAARDARFDGIFFVGVTSTGIYCRPICPAKTPREANCRFFDSAQQAEQATLPSVPALSPGAGARATRPWTTRSASRSTIVQRLEEGTIENDAGLEAIADQFELSSRQIRRIVRRELGVSPIQLLLTRRLLLAKQLLTETGLPVTEVAFASGFSSLRRFNDAFNSPLRAATDAPAAPGGAGSGRRHGRRRPRHCSSRIGRLTTGTACSHSCGCARSQGVERVDGGRLRAHRAPGRRPRLDPRAPVAGPRCAAARVHARPHSRCCRRCCAASATLFDLDARPDLIDRHLGRDTTLASLVRRTPGLRVPGAFNGFELGVRAILGQQVTVKAATTVAGRFARRVRGAALRRRTRSSTASRPRRRAWRARASMRSHATASSARARAASSRWRRRRSPAPCNSRAARSTTPRTASNA